jgi:ABC-type Fe3+-hydroxamate transport system substrate-binding protein
MNPDFVAGKNTFINSMLQACGLMNACSEARYPELEINNTKQVDYVFLSSEPYPFKEEHFVYFQQKFPKAKIVLVDGEIFSWYGSRMKLAPKYFQNLLKQLTH